MAKAQSVIKLVMAQEVERKYIGSVLSGKIRHKWKSIKSFLCSGEMCNHVQNRFCCDG